MFYLTHNCTVSLSPSFTSPPLLDYTTSTLVRILDSLLTLILSPIRSLSASTSHAYSPILSWLSRTIESYDPSSYATYSRASYTYPSLQQQHLIRSSFASIAFCLWHRASCCITSQYPQDSFEQNYWGSVKESNGHLYQLYIFLFGLRFGYVTYFPYDALRSVYSLTLRVWGGAWGPLEVPLQLTIWFYP